MSDPETNDSASKLRIDKWLWHARVATTRTRCAKLVSGGRVRVNGQHSRQSNRTIRPGDTVTIVVHSRVRILKVIALGARRGSAIQAKELFEDLSPEPEPQATAPRRVAGQGRPTKKERRQINRLRSSF